MNKRTKIILIFGALIFTLVALVYIPENTRQLKTQHFTFVYSYNIDGVKIDELAKALESNYQRVSQDLKTIPAKNIETFFANAI